MSCQRKGPMCMSCSNGRSVCGVRDFGSMPVIHIYPDGVKAVKRTEHRASVQAPARL